MHASTKPETTRGSSKETPNGSTATTRHDADIYDGTHPEARDWNQFGRALKVLDLISTYYFRTSVTGFDNVPDESSLVVGTHIGGLPAADLGMLFHAWYRRFGDQRPLYGLAHDIHFRKKKWARLLSLGGGMKASKAVALDILRRPNHHVIVFPAGARELLKPYHRRDRIDFHGHRGFVRLALEAGVPIVPSVSVGADTFFVLNEGTNTARLLGVDKSLRIPVFPAMISFPWGLTLGPAPHIPLPKQIRIAIGTPLRFNLGAEAANDPYIVDDIYYTVQSVMQGMRDRLARVKAVTQPLRPSIAELRAHVREALEIFEAWLNSSQSLDEETRDHMDRTETAEKDTPSVTTVRLAG